MVTAAVLKGPKFVQSGEFLQQARKRSNFWSQHPHPPALALTAVLVDCTASVVAVVVTAAAADDDSDDDDGV